jgi:hypothetical protein
MASRKKSRKAVWLLSLAALFLLAVVFAYPLRHRIKNRLKYYYARLENRLGDSDVSACERCPSLFNDGIAAHQAAYRNPGISPQQTMADLDALTRKGILKPVEDNDYYFIDGLTHSRPVLLPGAIDFLDELARVYSEKCTNENIEYVPFRITSATRSKASVQELREENKNAIDNSAHLFGRTFDISYSAFSENGPQRRQFIAALSELNKMGKCKVKYERNGCLHITSK